MSEQSEQDKVCVTRSTTNHNKLLYTYITEDCNVFSRLCLAVPLNIEMKNIIVKA